MSSAPDQGHNITLYRGWLDRGKHVWSPFVVKLEARFRFAGLKYATEAGSPRSAPKGKIPYVKCHWTSGPDGGVSADDGDGPACLGDTALIIKALTERGILPDLNARLSPAQKVEDMALRALLEDKLYFFTGREKWIDNYYTQRDHILWFMPWPARVLVGQLIYRSMTKTLHGQGTGRYSDDEIAGFRAEIWGALDGLLAASRASAGQPVSSSAPFWALGGEQPTEADATVFGFIVSSLICTACPETQKLIRGLPAVLDYAGRIHDKYFPDYEKAA